MYLGGNGLNFEVELDPDDTMPVHRSSCCDLGSTIGLNLLT